MTNIERFTKCLQNEDDQYKGSEAQGASEPLIYPAEQANQANLTDHDFDDAGPSRKSPESSNVGPSEAKESETSAPTGPSKADTTKSESTVSKRQSSFLNRLSSLPGWIMNGIQQAQQTHPKETCKTMRNHLEAAKEAVKDVGRTFFKWVYSKDIKQAEKIVDELKDVKEGKLTNPKNERNLEQLSSFVNHNIKGKLFDANKEDSLVSKIQGILNKAGISTSQESAKDVEPSKPEDDVGPSTLSM